MTCKSNAPGIAMRAILLGILWQGESVAAIDCTTPPVCNLNAITGSAGLAVYPFTQIGTYLDGYNTVKIKSPDSLDVYVGTNTQITRLPWKIWEHVYFGESSLTQNTNVRFWGTQVDNTGFPLIFKGKANWTVEIGQLNLDHVDMETQIKFLFASSDNRINLSNSGINFSSQGPGFVSTAPLTINALSGTNYFRNFNGVHSPLSTHINLLPGSSLLFDYSGSTAFDPAKDQRLYFYSQVIGSVNNAMLKLNYSNLYFNSSAFNFTNNSQLELQGYGSKVEFVGAAFDSSAITLHNNTTMAARDLRLVNTSLVLHEGARMKIAGDLYLDGSVLNIPAINAKIETDFATISGTTTLLGQNDQGGGLYASAISLKENAVFNLQGPRAHTQFLIMGTGSRLNINNSMFSTTPVVGAIYLSGGTVNVTNGGVLDMGGGLSDAHTLLENGTLNIDAASKIVVRDLLPLATNIIVNNQGTLYLDGKMSGDGTIGGNGTVVVSARGLISPGGAQSQSDLIQTITFENKVQFSNTVFPGERLDRQYLTHIDVVGGGDATIFCNTTIIISIFPA